MQNICLPLLAVRVITQTPSTRDYDIRLQILAISSLFSLYLLPVILISETFQNSLYFFPVVLIVAYSVDMVDI